MEKTKLTNDICLSCKKNLRVGGNYHKNSVHIAGNPPYFFYEWNLSKNIDNPKYCNLCYFAKEFICCRKENDFCDFHKKSSKIEKLEILQKILS